MKKDGKYRFSLQFYGDTQEKRDVRELLEGMGNRKSALIVEVLSRYILGHADICGNQAPQYPKAGVAIMHPNSNIDIIGSETNTKQHLDQPVKMEDREEVSQMLHNLNGFLL